VLGPQLEALIKKTDGVQLRKIDVPQGGSEAAAANGIRGVPTLWLYDGSKRVSTDAQDVMQRLASKTRG
jgi:hypothetical protein